MGSPLLEISTMVCSVQVVGKLSHIALLNMCAGKRSKVSQTEISVHQPIHHDLESSQVVTEEWRSLHFLE